MFQAPMLIRETTNPLFAFFPTKLGSSGWLNLQPAGKPCGLGWGPRRERRRCGMERKLPADLQAMTHMLIQRTRKNHRL